MGMPAHAAAAQATGNTPSWPSLYDLGIEIFPIEHENPIQTKGRYLYNANTIFRFTLYWTLIFYTPAFLLCGAYAFMNLNIVPLRQRGYHRRASLQRENIALQPYNRDTERKHMLFQFRSRAMQNEKRSRLMFSLLVVFVYAVFAVTGAVIGSALIGYVLAGLYKAGGYNMSTWMPFLGALLQTLVGFLGVWPSVVDII